MYSLSRLILTLALLVYGYCLIVIAILFSPISWYVLAVVVFIAFKKRKKLMNLTAHGTAFWAGEPELEQAKMLNSKRGLPLGRLIGSAARTGLLEAVNALLDKKLK